jgi:hypothetical protein
MYGNLFSSETQDRAGPREVHQGAFAAMPNRTKPFFFRLRFRAFSMSTGNLLKIRNSLNER